MTRKIRFLGLILTVTALAVFIMACRNPAGTATQFDIAVTISGAGSVTAPYSSAAGRMVTIEAEREDVPGNTFEFGKWRVVNSGGETIFTSTTKTASFRMPAEDVTIQAIFVDGNVFVTCENIWSFFGDQVYGIVGFMGTPPSDLIIPGIINGRAIQAIGGQGITPTPFEFKNLTSVSIPASVTYIHDSAFYGNDLTHVTIPASVTFIGGKAFGENQNLEKITILGNNVTIVDDTFLWSPSVNAPCAFYRDHGPTITQPGTFRWIAGDWVRQ